jgi:hypothetical protein
MWWKRGRSSSVSVKYSLPARIHDDGTGQNLTQKVVRMPVEYWSNPCQRPGSADRREGNPFRILQQSESHRKSSTEHHQKFNPPTPPLPFPPPQFSRPNPESTPAPPAPPTIPQRAAAPGEKRGGLRLQPAARAVPPWCGRGYPRPARAPGRRRRWQVVHSALYSTLRARLPLT